MAAARKKDDDDSDGAIHKMDTLPPPEGEDDAYSAATKVGPMARAAVEAMMAKAQVDENSSLPPPASFTRGVTLPKPARLPALEEAHTDEVQRVYDDGDDGDLFDPTALLVPAPPPPIARASPAPVAPTLPPIAASPEPAPISPAASTPSRFEIAVFATTFLLLVIPPLLAYIFFLR